MAISEIYPFAIGDGANVLTPADYKDASYRQQGFQDGIVEAYDYNIVARQASFVASAVARFVADASAIDVLDNGDVDGLATQFARAIRGSLGPGAPFYARDTSSVVNRITITLPELQDFPNATILPEGSVFLVRVNQDNTGPVTFRLNGRQSVAITYPDGSALKKGALKQNAMVVFFATPENTVQMQGVISPAPSISRNYFGREAGTGNAFVVPAANITPALNDLDVGTQILIQPGHPNTGPATLQIGSLPAYPLVIGTGAPVPSGAIQAGAGFEVWFDGQSFQIVANYAGSYAAGGNVALVRRPTNVSPAAGATNVSTTTSLVGSAYQSLYSVAQGGAEWQVANDPDFTSGLLTYSQSGAGTSYTLPGGAVPANATRYWRARYKDTDNAFSDWSVATAFTTGATANIVNQPSITSPADGEPAASVRPTLVSTAFAITGDADTHAASQWEIARDAGFQNIVFPANGTPVDDTTNLTSFTPPSNAALTPQLDYYGRVRHKGTNKGYSAWSNGNRFRTQASPDRPSLTYPVDGTTGIGLGPNLTSSAFSMPGGAHSASQWQVDNNSDFSSPVFDSSDDAVNLTSKKLPSGTLAFNTLYYARVRHKESGGTYSPWSLVNSFRTAVVTGIASVYAQVYAMGTNSALNLTTGVDLQGNDGIVELRGFRPTDSTKSPTDPLFVKFSTKRGLGRYTVANDTLKNGEQTASTGTALAALGTNGVTLGAAGVTTINESGVYQLVTVAAVADGWLYHDVITHNGTSTTIDLSSLGTVGMVKLRAVSDTVEQAGYLGGYAWHRIPGNNRRLKPGYLTRPSNDPNPLQVTGTTLTIGAAVSVPAGIYILEAWAHKETSDSLIFCGQVSTDPSLPTDQRGVAQLPFKPQSIELIDITAFVPLSPLPEDAFWWNWRYTGTAGSSSVPPGGLGRLDTWFFENQTVAQGITNGIVQYNGAFYVDPNVVGTNRTFAFRAIRAAS